MSVVQSLYESYRSTAVQIVSFAKTQDVGVSLQAYYDNMYNETNLMTFCNCHDLWILNQCKRIKSVHNKNSRVVTQLDAIVSECKRSTSAIKKELGYLDVHYFFGILFQNDGLMFLQPFLDADDNVNSAQAFFEIFNAKFLGLLYRVSYFFFFFSKVNH